MVLPDPDAPTIAIAAPGCTSNVTPSRIDSGASPLCTILVSPSARISGGGIETSERRNARPSQDVRAEAALLKRNGRAATKQRQVGPATGDSFDCTLPRKRSPPRSTLESPRPPAECQASCHPRSIIARYCSLAFAALAASAPLCAADAPVVLVVGDSGLGRLRTRLGRRLGRSAGGEDQERRLSISRRQCVDFRRHDGGRPRAFAGAAQAIPARNRHRRVGRERCAPRRKPAGHPRQSRRDRVGGANRGREGFDRRHATAAELRAAYAYESRRAVRRCRESAQGGARPIRVRRLRR